MGSTLQWFEAYLRGRGQKVYINGTLSDLFDILEMGLVQGSSLSCLLFYGVKHYRNQTYRNRYAYFSGENLLYF